MMKKSFYLVFSLLISFNFSMTAATVLTDSWSNVVYGKSSDQNTAWWSSSEAIRIAENVLLYQKDCGGWTKNINMQLVLTDAQKTTLKADKPKNTDCCIDNGAVTYELLYLSKVHKAITNDSLKNVIRTAFTKGILYLLKAQYANGGWPQFYPYRGGYSNHITYNDNAMINVMEILRRIYKKDTYYSITLSDSIANVAKTAFDKGVNCVLKTQYIQKNRLSVWCAQHDYKTLVPVMARSYELASLSGAESAGIIKLLISLDNPSKEIKRAIYSSVAWYDESRIKGQKLESFTNSDGLSDKRVVADPTASDMWARFYTLSDNRPFFCDRDGIMKFSLAEIGYERRNGYSWYSTSGFDVITTYNTWLPKWGTTIVTSPLPNTTFQSNDSVPVIAFSNKYTGSALKKTDMILDDQLSQTFNAMTVKTSLKGLKAGSHTLIITSEYANGKIESDTTNFIVAEPNSINSLTGENKLQCYPNPSRNGFHVTLLSDEFKGIEIFNQQNQLIYKANCQSNNYFLDKSILSSGVYFVRVKDLKNNYHNHKVLVLP